MRSVINISLPEAMVKSVKKEVKSGNYGSTSEFFRHLLRLWDKGELDDDQGKWETISDFTKIQKGGVPARKVLKHL